MTRTAMFALLMAALGCAPGPRSRADERSIRRIPHQRALIQTDSAVYTAHRRTVRGVDDSSIVRSVELTIGLTYTNATGRPMYLPSCQAPYPPALEKQEGDKWILAYDPVVPACATPPIVVPPGQKFSYAFVVDGSLYVPGPRRQEPRFRTEVPGVYRLVWGGAYEVGDTAQGRKRVLPLAARISNQFQIVE